MWYEFRSHGQAGSSYGEGPWKSKKELRTKLPKLLILRLQNTKIQKKIHPDISPETTRLSAIVNEAKDLILKNKS